MAQPVAYTRSFSFTNYGTTNPEDPLPGNRVDIELNNIKTTLDQIRTNLALLQRDDGALANGLVGVSQLSGSLSSLELDTPSSWVTATAYVVDNVVFQSSKLYVCLVAHTSGTFATDLAAAKWEEIADFTTLVSDAEAAVVDAEAAQAAAEAAQTAAEAAQTAAEAASGDIVADIGANVHRWHGAATGTNNYTVSAITDYSPATPTDGTAADFFVTNGNNDIVTLTYGAWSSKPVKRFDGTALVSGDWPSGSIVSCRYKSSTGFWYWLDSGIATETQQGRVELATTAEAEAGTDTARAVTPAGLLAAATGQETVWIPATAMVSRATNGAAAGSVETATNKVMLKTLDFDTTTQEFAQFSIQMPKGWDEGTIIAQFIWSHPAAAAFGVVWGIEAVAFANDDAADAAFGTAVTAIDTGGTTNDIYISPETNAMTVAGSPGAEEWVVFQVKRVPADAADTLGVDARLHGVKLHYTTNTFTDD
jgi:hypothetical protein